MATKISTKAAQNFINGVKFKSGQTAVEVGHSVINSKPVKALSLYGHVIASQTGDALLINFCGYPTATTKERLNALMSELRTGLKFHTKKGVLCCNERPINDNGLIYINELQKICA